MLTTRTRSQYRSNDRRVVPFDAASQLKSYHRRIRRLFEQFGMHHSDNDITALVQKICDQLAIYLAIKEEIVYPNLCQASHRGAPIAELNESVIEHFSLKFMMGMLDGQTPGDQLFVAKVHVLERHFIHHVEADERWLLPELLLPDFSDLSRRIQERRNELDNQILG